MKPALTRRLLPCLAAAAAAALAIPFMARSLAADRPRQISTPGVFLQAVTVSQRPNGTAPGLLLPPPNLADFSKGRIERPAKVLVAKRTGPAEPILAGPAFSNPRVPAGKVRWHATFEQACAASESSKKPVLLFSMMGRLDEKFC